MYSVHFCFLDSGIFDIYYQVLKSGIVGATKQGYYGPMIFGSRYSRMDQVKFEEDSLVCLGRGYRFKFFKGWLPQILLGPFLSILTHLFLDEKLTCFKGSLVQIFTNSRKTIIQFE